MTHGLESVGVSQADRDGTLSQQVFDIPVSRVEPLVEPDCVADDVWRESVTFISIHLSIVPISETLLGNTLCAFILIPVQYPLIKIGSITGRVQTMALAGVNHQPGRYLQYP
jgi:hypothetical protein